MKKLYTLLSVLALTATASAQTNLVENGGFENWSGTNPTGFDPVGNGTTGFSGNNFLTKETTIVHSGSNSAKHQSQENTQSLEYSELIDVTPGTTYTLTYWYLDNSTTAKSRIWSAWLPSDSTTALDNDADILRPQSQNDPEFGFSSDSPNWVKKELVLTAPAGAARFRFQVRTNRQTTNQSGGFIYYDDLSFVQGNVASVKDNAISGLKMFPNPLTGTTLNILSDNNDVKTVAIFDVLGKQVVSTKTTTGAVNVSNLSSGVYMVKITEAGKTSTRKLVVK